MSKNQMLYQNKANDKMTLYSKIINTITYI